MRDSHCTVSESNFPERVRGSSASRGDDPPRCAACDKAIGVYEPLRWLLPDGSMVESGWMHLGDDPRAKHPDSRLFHALCAAAL